MRNYEETVIKRRDELKKGIGIMDAILADEAVGDVNLRLLIEKITVSEKDGKLQLSVMLKGNFRHHMDIYEDGEITDRFFETDLTPTDEGKICDWIPVDMDE